ncbi:MAG: hypothetical protein ACI4UU_00975 [Clostridia bacterium]
MTSGRPTILDRLEHSALNGRTSANLNLYLGQEKKLIRDGFTVTRIASVPARHGQHSCNIDWSKAPVDTEAYALLSVASNATEKKQTEE